LIKISTPKEHIERIVKEIHELYAHNHVTQVNEYVAVQDMETNLSELRKAFDYGNKLNDGK